MICLDNDKKLEGYKTEIEDLNQLIKQPQEINATFIDNYDRILQSCNNIKQDDADKRLRLIHRLENIE